MEMKRAVVLDLEALRVSADHSPRIERQMVSLFISTADRCLSRMQALVVRGDAGEWQKVVHELEGASGHIHANEIAALCKNVLDSADTAVSRMGAYLHIKEAYEGLLIHFRNADLLARNAQGD